MILKEDAQKLATLAVLAGSLYAAKKFLDMRKKNKRRPGNHDDEEREIRDYQTSID